MTHDRLTIGVVVGNASSPHNASLIKEIQEAAKHYNVNIICYLGMHTTDYYRFVFAGETSKELAGDNFDYQCNVVYDYARLGKVDALIISYGTLCIFLENNNQAEFLKRFDGIPYILVDERTQDPGVSSVITDNYGGMYALAEHLVRDHGYRRIAYLAGPRGNTDADERLRAVEDVMVKYGVPFGADQIEYGDYSSCVARQVNALLTRVPETQALICANDMMAATAYRECENRGYIVGQDIAITGFDDIAMASLLTPPLTTVRQSAYHMGMMAMQKLLELYHGAVPQAFTNPAPLVIRSSCGCMTKQTATFPDPKLLQQGQIAQYVAGVSAILAQRMISPDSNEGAQAAVRAEVARVLKGYITLYYRGELGKVNRNHLADRLSRLLDGEYSTYVRNDAMLQVFSDYLKSLLQYQKPTGPANDLFNLLNVVTETVQAADAKACRENLLQFERESWFMPLITRSMIDCLDDECAFYRAALQRLPPNTVRRCDLFLLPQPLEHHYGEPWSCPPTLYLAASSDRGTITSYAPEMRPTITLKHGFTETLAPGDQFSMCALPLFSGAVQYGLLMAEIEQKDLNLLYLCSQQINVGLEFHEMNLRQIANRRRLEQMNRELNDKNEILGHLSKYDPMTNCLNRRGFLEDAVQYLRARRGRRMWLFFTDLNHLKEINDRFGHAEGDFAIRAGVQFLREIFPDSAPLARIGGDEFLVLTQAEPWDTADADASRAASDPAECIAAVNRFADQFNAASGKPYYVEMSIGAKEFISEENTRVVDFLQDADLCLYEAKRNRKRSVCRTPGEAAPSGGSSAFAVPPEDHAWN